MWLSPRSARPRLATCGDLPVRPRELRPLIYSWEIRLDLGVGMERGRPATMQVSEGATARHLATGPGDYGVRVPG
jgi:hypothetical protein